MSIYIVKNELHHEIAAFTDIGKAESFAQRLHDVTQKPYTCEEIKVTTPCIKPL
jgi:hypothetical protein